MSRSSALAPLDLGTVSVWPPVMSAPMAGYTGFVYREILREHGCPYCYTEMVSAKGLIFGGDGSREILEHGPSDRPLAVQLFGDDPEDIVRAVRIIHGSGYEFDAIDINMGCPARKVTSQGSGGALLKDLRRAADIVRAAKSATHLPVTAKTRLGWDETGSVEEIARTLAEAGLDMLAVHGRTVSQGYSGAADWSGIYLAASSVSIPVVGNGDIRTPQEALSRLEGGPVSGVMVGRALLGNPTFFQDLSLLLKGKEPAEHPAEERMRLAAEHFRRAVEAYGEQRGVLDMRKQLVFYFRGIPGAARLREMLMRERSAAGVLEILERRWREDP